MLAFFFFFFFFFPPTRTTELFENEGQFRAHFTGADDGEKARICEDLGVTVEDMKNYLRVSNLVIEKRCSKGEPEPSAGEAESASSSGSPSVESALRAGSNRGEKATKLPIHFVDVVNDLDECDTEKAITARFLVRAKQVCKILENMAAERGQVVSKLTVGKTYADGACFSVKNPNTWTIKGLSSRWSKTYAPASYTGMQVLGAVSEAEVPRELRACEEEKEKKREGIGLRSGKVSRRVFLSEQLTLRIESELQKWVKESDHLQDEDKNWSSPGRLSKTRHSAYVLYIAYQFASPASAVATSIPGPSRNDREKN
jgi:hypothetical protein